MNSQENVEVQGIPVKVYRSEERITIAAPMPGLEPENVTVHVSEGPIVTLHGELRGTLKDEKEVLLDEWTPGPYHREVDLPSPVDGERANVTYSNGVLVVALPVSDQVRTAELQLESVSAAKGQRVGHRGHETPPSGSARRA